MLFIELSVPKGVFGEAERRDLAGRLTGRRLLSSAHGAPDAVDPGVMDLLDSLSHVVVREEEIWVTGGETPDAARNPWYVVNVTVGMWGKEMSDHLITRVSAELADWQGDPEPRVLVNVIPVPEGGYGVYGRPHRSPDMLRLIEEAKTGSAAPASDGMIVDPLCGATIPLSDAVILERDGQTYGFCCSHCRGHFAKRLKDASVS
ncbi:YHS domain protein [Microbispora sp. RL4-1S]|uniref:YHS domain protein n=1 Tax=Microbispora oryzae TaxID=2806554 RepID=A0A940WKK9_9ACTN|nr:YHS domain protein [Microbispora oryzae]MBP2704613.1 YHS domain protein [Microbispora oryzae]